MSVSISVLVPVFNVEKTLDRCLNSILNQTFMDYEIILVDDGSTDASGSICDVYAEKYAFVRVIHKTNEGLGPTRNRGICEASGDYIYHCDSDDWLEPELLEKAYKEITRVDADVLVFGYNIYSQVGTKIHHYDKIQIESAVYDNTERIHQLFTKEYFHSFIVLSACNRLYKRAFIIDNDLFFPPLRRCQDMAYSLLLFDHIQKLATMHEAYYCYIIEPGVFKGRSFEEMIDIYLTIYTMTSKYFTQWGTYDTNCKQMLSNYICEQVANYTSYALIKKYKREWRKNAACLLQNGTVRALFLKYTNTKQSRFMYLFCKAIMANSAVGLFGVCAIAQKIGKMKDKNK